MGWWYDAGMEPHGTNAMEYIRTLENMVRQYRTEDRVFRGGSFLLGFVAGAVIGVFGPILAHLLLR